MQADKLATAFHNLLKSPSGKQARDYLKTRGVLDHAIDQFMIGYSNRGYFADRVTFPVFDRYAEARMISSRTIDPEEKKRHKHSAGVKMEWFYNEPPLPTLSKYVVLCESPIDVITLEQIGICAVGAMGANNMNRGKVLKLENIKRVYICFDNDINESGQKAAVRVGNMCDMFNQSQEVYNIHIPFILGSDINSMYVADREHFKDNFRECFAAGTRIIAPVPEPRKRYDGPVVTKYPILDIVERYVDHLTPCGAGRYKTICPFHDEEDASFHVDEIKNRFKCFGCGRSGDTIDFLIFISEKMGKRMGFRDALAILDTQSSQ